MHLEIIVVVRLALLAAGTLTGVEYPLGRFNHDKTNTIRKRYVSVCVPAMLKQEYLSRFY